MAGLVKHFKETMQGIPQLSNNWGSMITVLDAVLVNGFNFRTILNLSKPYNDAITATIQLASGHGFIDRQVIRISGSTNGWDGDFKVLSANANDIVIECLSTHPNTISGSSTCFTAPLDFEIIYSTATGSSEPKRAYRSKNLESLRLILLVHDFCASGAAQTGAKFAKVGVVSSMSDINTITGTQMPFSELYSNWTWDGTRHGWSKWYYAFKEESYPYLHYTTLDSTTPSNGNRTFRIVGDDSSFALVVRDYCAYGFLEFEDQLLSSNNLVLYATGLNSTVPVAQNTGILTFGRGALGTIYRAAGDASEKAQIWFNAAGQLAPERVGYPIYATVTPTSASTPQFNVTSGQALSLGAYIDKPILDLNGKFRGVLPFYKLCLEKNNNEQITNHGIIYQRYNIDNGDYWFGLNLESV